MNTGITAHGHIKSVADKVVGDFVATAAVATDTDLVVDDLSPFSEDGGTILIVDEDTANETVAYTGFDADTETLLLDSALAQNHAVGTPVQVSPEQMDRIAYVQPDDPDLEPIPARVPFSLKDRVQAGLRSEVVGDEDVAGDYELPEEVIIELGRGGWVLADVLRKDVVLTADIMNSENGFLLSGDGVFLPARPIGSYWIYDDFTNTAQSGQANGVSQSANGTGAAWSAGTAELSRPGVWNGETGTTTSGRAGLSSGLGAYLLGGGEMRLGCWLRTPTTLSDAGNRYSVAFGFWDTTTISTATNAVELRYQDNLVSGNWMAETQSASASTTFSDTGIPNDAGTWYHLEIAVNADASQVDFYIDKELAVSHTANIPSASMELRIQIEKIVGTTSRTFRVDAYYINGLLATPR